MAEICVDANVVIDYARERAKRELGIKSASVNAAMLRKHLGRSLGEGRVVIPSTAYDEAQSNLDKDVTRMVDKADAERVLARATLVISAHLSNSVRIDNLALVDEAREMYKAARSIPKSQKFAEWYSRKSRHVSRPLLGSGNDLVILSTAAQNAKRVHVELWTGDIDFTMFADEIAVKFNVEVVDTSRLNERFAG